MKLKEQPKTEVTVAPLPEIKLTPLQNKIIHQIAEEDERSPEQVLSFIIESGLVFRYGSVSSFDFNGDGHAEVIRTDRLKTEEK